MAMLLKDQSMIATAFTEKPVTFREKWLAATVQVFPLYLAVHLAFFVMSMLSLLFTHGDFDPIEYPINSLWQSWNRWDVGNFIHIAQQGYTERLTAFFPLYPLLMRAMAHMMHCSAFAAGLVISNVSLLIVLIVLYQLVQEDFDEETANRAVLYLCTFPAAFFLVTAYSEALFLCFAVLSFYQMRHGKWWLAGMFGCLASLTRSSGLLLVVPFVYEYLHVHDFSWKRLRPSIAASLLIPAGTMIFALYCYHRFGDLLSFAHAQSSPGWDRHLSLPWTGLALDVQLIASTGSILDYVALRNLLDLVPDVFLLLVLLISLWKFPRKSYAFLGLALWLFFDLYPRIGSGADPLTSQSRLMIEIFPAFVFLALLGKHRWFHVCYVAVSSSMLFFMLTQFLSGHWVL